jgi:hypothetical protein
MLIRAVNLMDGMHLIGADDRSQPLQVRRVHGELPVYSMDVDGERTYVADGVVTHNCYVRRPDPDAGKPWIYASAGRVDQEPAPDWGDGWVVLTPEKAALMTHMPERWREGYLGRWVKIEPKGALTHDKFYFQHLSDADKHRFVDLLNAGRFNLGAPGYFYVRPYFVIVETEP